MNLKEALDRIEAGAPAPCYLVHGDEGYLVQEAFQRITEALLPGPERAMNLVLLEGDVADVPAVCQALLSVPLFPGRKVIAVRNTVLFHSRTTMPNLVREMQEQVEGGKDLSRALRMFSTFLGMARWSLEDLQDEGWRRISPEEWRKTAGVDDPGSVEKWLVPILEHAKACGWEGKAGKGAEGRLEQILERGLPEGHILVLSALSVDRRKRLYQLMAERGVVLAFDREKGEARVREQFRRVALDFVRSRGKEITADAVDLLGERTGWGLAPGTAVLESLLSFAGEKRRIDVGDVESLAAETREYTVFDLTGALAAREASRALKALHSLLRRGEPPLMVFAMIAREIRHILHARILLDRDMAGPFRGNMDYGAFQRAVYPVLKGLGEKRGKNERGILGQHPYVVYQALKQADLFTRDEAFGFFDRLVRLDLEMKTTGRDPALLLERYLLDVCR